MTTKQISKMLIALAVLLFGTALIAGPEQSSLRITAPADKADVPQRAVFEGTSPSPNANVWVIVHPMEIADYWVQPRVTVNEDGTWKVNTYIGRPGADTGKSFEVLAVAKPESELHEGKVLDGWPKAQWKSQVVQVTRK